MRRFVAAATLVLAVPAALGRLPAAADQATPTPAPTVAAATELPATATTTPLAAVQMESSPVPSATPLPTPSATTASAGAVPVPTMTSSPPVSYLPSAAQLQESARLRWGSGIPPQIRRWAFLIVPTARRYGLDPDLVAAVITMESNGDPSAWNQSSDARGLMQVLHGPFDPASNINAGAGMLAGFMAEFHRVDLALAAYNAGPGAVLQYGGVPPYRETHDYVIIVTYLYALYGHHRLSPVQTTRYRRTLHDLRHFRDQRRKIRALALAAHLVHIPACGHCASRRAVTATDAFWPMPGLPDPLQQVGP